jgi:release factor glutamine methyltransferase
MRGRFSMPKGKNIFFYKGKIFVIEEYVQGPDTYSLFLEESLIIHSGEVALDIVTGTGFHAIMMAEKASKVVGVDINAVSVRCAKINVLLNDVEGIVDVRQGDLFDAIMPSEKFNLIVAWPPVLPTPLEKERHDWLGIANEGGRNGRKIIDRIISQSNRFLKTGGRLQLLQPWYTNIPLSIDMLNRLGFRAELSATAEFPVGQLSFERAFYLKELGFPLLEKDGELRQQHFVITAWWDHEDDPIDVPEQ